MSTRGYSSYNGRGSKKTVIIVIVLVLILISAIGYMLAQNYIVYDDQGNSHLELPFSKEKETEDVSEPESSVSIDDVQIEYVEPEYTHPDISALHALEMPAGTLWWKTAYVLSLAADDMAINVKRPSGHITYTTKIDMPKHITVEGGNTAKTLASILESDKYVVAIISSFLDYGYAKQIPESALQTADGNVWTDRNDYGWLDPANNIAQEHITALCQECATMGFDELALDYYSYPVSGKLSSIAYSEDLDKTAVLTDYARALRKNLPEGIVLSIILREDISPESGLTPELLENCFDRIYVSSSVDTDALLSQLSSHFDASTRLVYMTSKAQDSGSYLILDD